ncbi:MAG: hypothetical protein QME63_02745 [Actinomycetota bacterium]|nr:hypothetical protein [Actinomycetota bacterium]
MKKRRVLSCFLALFITVSLVFAPVMALADNSQSSSSPQAGQQASIVGQANDQQSSLASQSTNTEGNSQNGSNGCSTGDAVSKAEDESAGSASGGKQEAKDSGVAKTKAVGSETNGSTESTETSEGSHSNETRTVTPSNVDGVNLYTETEDRTDVTNITEGITGNSTSQGNNSLTDLYYSPYDPPLHLSGEQITYNNANNQVLDVGVGKATSGSAETANIVKDNPIDVARDNTVTVDRQGEIDSNSNVTVNIQYQYWTELSAIASATSGDSSATAVQAENLISDVAKVTGNNETVGSSGGSSGGRTSLAANGSNNTIANGAVAVASSGDAGAANIIIDNTIKIAPITETLLSIVGDVINSSVTVNVIYKFAASIIGEAIALTGNANATGVDADNSINNSASTQDAAVGSSGGDLAAYNSTENKVMNLGIAGASSGDSFALNLIKNNSIVIAPVISCAVELLNTITDAEVVIDIAYNFVAKICGSAKAETGNASATGVDAENSISNSAVAAAEGGENSGSGGALAVNGSRNSITNKGGAIAEGGSAKAINAVVGSSINLSPTIATAVQIVDPVTGKLHINVVYDVFADLFGSATSKADDITATGLVAKNTISNSAYAEAAEGANSNDAAFSKNMAINDLENAGYTIGRGGNADTKNIATADILYQENVVDKIIPGANSNGVERCFSQEFEVKNEAISHVGGVNVIGDRVETTLVSGIGPEVKNEEETATTENGSESNSDLSYVPSNQPGNNDNGNTSNGGDAANNSTGYEQAGEGNGGGNGGSGLANGLVEYPTVGNGAKLATDKVKKAVESASKPSPDSSTSWYTAVFWLAWLSLLAMAGRWLKKRFM